MGNYRSMTATTSPGGLAAAVVAQIKAERAALDIPMGTLAKEVGITPRSLTRYFSGEREMTLGLVEKFAIALKLDFATLMERAAERRDQ